MKGDIYMPQNITMIPGKDYDGTTVDGLIYQNGPENLHEDWFDTDAFGRAFTYIPLTAGKVYEVEFYNWNYTKTKTARLSFGIKNNSTTAGQVTVLKQAIRVSAIGSGTPYVNSQYLGQEMTLAFMQDTRNDIVSIPGNTGTTQGFKSLLSGVVNRSPLQLINGRIRFRVNSGSSLYAKIFFVDSSKLEWEKFAGWTNLLSTADLNRIDSGGSEKYIDQYMATGLYSNIKRGMSIPNTNPIQIAYGAKANNVIIDKYNTNEFETPTYPINVRKGNLGNFGIVYTPYCSVATAKYFKITPKATTPKDGRYVIRENGIWKQANATPASPYKGTLTAGTSFWFVLAGGNTGDVEIVFSTTSF